MRRVGASVCRENLSHTKEGGKESEVSWFSMGDANREQTRTYS